ncbi:C4-dicarboxylate ABC transporter [Nocardia sp. SYP-A9097]|uniref:TDT family transporter n=1 Tax=Nocardia sp. SYP-A9097 TaxID=2663237 RepID=UPI00129A76F2|nr:TDT family transporter [Nocardia sp. SYP-A9097]MRH89721.1 C4-dicarboxylate ABC transporter [Nocardia sp. SYP-A9097]
MTTLTFRPSADAESPVVESRTAAPSHNAVDPAGAPGNALRGLAPNWFAVVMGTGIIANAAATLPLQFPGLRMAATVVWALAALLLIGVSAAWVAHWRRHPDVARSHGANPVMMQFYGAPPMALLTVGAGTLLLGSDVIGMSAAVTIDWVLWSAGTVLGLISACVIPFRMITRHTFDGDAAFGGWLMPIVPPMVSAATGALLIPHTPAGQPRLTLLFACLAMFGLSLIAALITITMIWSRLLHHGLPAASMVATVWIVLGPLGQSITAAGQLANVARTALPERETAALDIFALLFGVPTWGFAMLWLGIAIAVTVHTRKSMRFNMTWWGFTFPLGTCVTGSTVLYSHTGAVLFAVVAVALFALLVTAWSVVAARTLHGAMHGNLLRPTA